MADNYQNRNNQQSYNDQDWDQNRERYERGYDRFQKAGYGNEKGHGGYQNRNYENENNQWQNRGGNRGSGGYQDQSSYRSNYENRGNYDDMSHSNYGEVYGGNLAERERLTNQARGGKYSSGNRTHGQREDNNRNYGYSGNAYGGNYNSRNDNNYNQYSSHNENRGRYDNDQGWWDRTKEKVSSWFDDDDDRSRGDRNYENRGGLHRGKGPKGYKRSDERILEDVCDRLSDDDALDASDIEVRVQGSEVMLDGRVENREAKRRAEDLAERISGVSNVQNNLKVSPIEGIRTTNAVISAVAERNNPTYTNQINKDR